MSAQMALSIPGVMAPRPYQAACIQGNAHAFQKHRAVMDVLATGTGKSVIAAHEAALCSGSTIFLAHRDALIRQAAQKLRHVTQMPVGIEKADEYASPGSVCVAASVQTLRGQRLESFAKFWAPRVELIVWDECHGILTKERLAILAAFPEARILGLTATADRSDGKSLGAVFKAVGYRYDIVNATADAWLTPGSWMPLPLSGVSLDSVGLKGGDIDQGALDGETVKLAAEIALGVIQNAKGRRSLIFTPGVRTAEAGAAALNARIPGCARYISGAMKDDERDAIEKGHKAGEFPYLLNCLDDKTEVLTESGWVGIDEITAEHRVANWKDGKVYFEPPKAIMSRQRAPGERMVVLETKNRSIRVTEGHRMLYRTNLTDGTFKVKTAAELVGKHCQLPVHGHSDPLARMAPPAVPFGKGTFGRRVAVTSYNLRKTLGLSYDESVKEAGRRIHRRDGLRALDPNELSLEQCALIGFWIGDGSQSRLIRGGIEYTLAQAPTSPVIVAWIDSLLMACGIHNLRKDARPKRNVITWSLPRGTGSGPQEREGVFSIEPYLKKDGTDLFWGLSDRQFEVLLHGLHLADGNHGDSTARPRLMQISGINRRLFDLLQAIAVCRGYRASIRTQKTTAKPHHIPLLILSLTADGTHHLATKYRMKFEDGHKEERVWCVTTSSGNIITRRNDKVTVTGQCQIYLEGYDDQEIICIFDFAKTKSRLRWAQKYGRGTRLWPRGIDHLDSIAARRLAIATSPKGRMYFFDALYGSHSHDLAGPTDLLGGTYPEEVRKTACGILEEKGGGDVQEALAEAKARLAEREQSIEAIARAAAKAKGDAAALAARPDSELYGQKPKTPFELLGMRDPENNPWLKNQPQGQASPKMLGWLRWKKVPVPEGGMSAKRARSLMLELRKREASGKASYEQLAALERRGVTGGKGLGYEAALRMLAGKQQRRERIPGEDDA